MPRTLTPAIFASGLLRIKTKKIQVWDRERVIIIPDHYIFTADQRANRNVDILREFVQEQNIK